MAIPASVKATSLRSPDRRRHWRACGNSARPVACFGTTAYSGQPRLKGLYGQHRESDAFAGPGKTIARSIDATVTPNANSGGFGSHQDGEFKRNVYKVDVAKFWGGHEIKGGVDWEDVESEVNRFEGGAGIARANSCPRPRRGARSTTGTDSSSMTRSLDSIRPTRRRS